MSILTMTGAVAGHGSLSCGVAVLQSLPQKWICVPVVVAAVVSWCGSWVLVFWFLTGGAWKCVVPLERGEVVERRARSVRRILRMVRADSFWLASYGFLMLAGGIALAFPWAFSLAEWVFLCR